MMPVCLGVVQFQIRPFSSTFAWAPAQFVGVLDDKDVWQWSLNNFMGPWYASEIAAVAEACRYIGQSSGPFMHEAEHDRPINVEKYKAHCKRLGFPPAIEGPTEFVITGPESSGDE